MSWRRGETCWRTSGLLNHWRHLRPLWNARRSVAHPELHADACLVWSLVSSAQPAQLSYIHTVLHYWFLLCLPHMNRTESLWTFMETTTVGGSTEIFVSHNWSYWSQLFWTQIAKLWVHAIWWVMSQQGSVAHGTVPNCGAPAIILEHQCTFWAPSTLF